MVQPGSILCDAESGHWPNITTAVLESCVLAFWRDVSFQMPIVRASSILPITTEDAPLFLLEHGTLE